MIKRTAAASGDKLLGSKSTSAFPVKVTCPLFKVTSDEVIIKSILDPIPIDKRLINVIKRFKGFISAWNILSEEIN
jgi:hypothetical protein